jgi:hypothetical protein
LRASTSGLGKKQGEVFGAIDIEPDSSKIQNGHLETCGACGRQMRLKTVVAEPKWNQVTGATKNPVSAPLVRRRRNYASL